MWFRYIIVHFIIFWTTISCCDSHSNKIYGFYRTHKIDIWQSKSLTNSYTILKLFNIDGSFGIESPWSIVFYDLWRSWARWACLCWPTMNAGPLNPNYSRTKSAPGARRMGQGGHVRWVFPDGYSRSLLNGSWVHIILKSLIIFSWPFLRIYSHDWWW